MAQSSPGERTMPFCSLYLEPILLNNLISSNSETKD